MFLLEGNTYLDQEGNTYLDLARELIPLLHSSCNPDNSRLSLSHQSYQTSGLLRLMNHRSFRLLHFPCQGSP